jgi:RNase P/RNase MRP subunit p29
MRRHILLALAAAASLALAGNLLAQSTPVQVPPGTPTSTVTGTVVSSSDSELVLDTTGGRQRFVVDANSTLPVKLDAGTRVSVEFHRLDGDRMHVARVTTAAASTSPRAGAAPTADKTPAASSETTSERYARQERADRDAAARAERSADATLPRTASPLPLVGLLGLASLAGSAALRLASRNR